MKARAASPDMLVDLNGLEELKGIELAGDGTLTIGAMTTYTELMALGRGEGAADPRRGLRDDRRRPGAEPRHDRRQRLLERPDEPPAAADGRGRRADDDRRRRRRARSRRRRSSSSASTSRRSGPGELLTKISIPAGKKDGFAAVTLGADGTCIANAAATVNGSRAGRARLRRRGAGARHRRRRPDGSRATRCARANLDAAVRRSRLERVPDASRRGARDRARSRRRRCGAADGRHGHRQRRRVRARRRAAQAPDPLPPRRPRPDRQPHRLRHRQLRRVLGDRRRHAREELHAARRPGRRRERSRRSRGSPRAAS